MFYIKKVFLKFSKNSPENTCARAPFYKKFAGPSLNFVKKETLAQVFSCGFWKIFSDCFYCEVTLLSEKSLI